MIEKRAVVFSPKGKGNTPRVCMCVRTHTAHTRRGFTTCVRAFRSSDVRGDQKNDCMIWAFTKWRRFPVSRLLPLAARASVCSCSAWPRMLQLGLLEAPEGSILGRPDSGGRVPGLAGRCPQAPC